MTWWQIALIVVGIAAVTSVATYVGVIWYVSKGLRG
jgi:hypothetical protein